MAEFNKWNPELAYCKMFLCVLWLQSPLDESRMFHVPLELTHVVFLEMCFKWASMNDKFIIEKLFYYNFQRPLIH